MSPWEEEISSKQDIKTRYKVTIVKEKLLNLTPSTFK